MSNHYQVVVETLGALVTETVRANVLATDPALVDMARQQAGIDPAVFVGGHVVGLATPDRAPVTAEPTGERALVADGGTVAADADHGTLKRRLATLIGADPSRYAAERGVERHKRLTAAEIDKVCDALGIGFIDGTAQTKRDTVMIKLGRDHRTGVSMWDSSDLIAVIDRLTGGASNGE